MIFVFGSNEAGRHGAGAALAAAEYHGAIEGQGEGPMGNSYAIPTKSFNWKYSLTLNEVKFHVDQFLGYARANPQLKFQVTCIGCGLAGFRDDQIAPLFVSAPSNCLFDEEWLPYLPDGTNFWGTFK